MSSDLKELYYECKSACAVRGIPLWHIDIGAGWSACGIFAPGLAARRVFSCGLVSMGVFSCGVLSLGAVAWYVVIGDSAGAQVTICVSETFGEFTRAGGYSDGLYLELLDKIDSTAPHLLGWVGNIIKAIF